MQEDDLQIPALFDRLLHQSQEMTISELTRLMWTAEPI